MFNRKGFTLVEVLLVIVIIGVLAAVVIPRMLTGKTEAQKAACDANVAALNSQIELYHLQDASGDYPTALTNMIPDYIDSVPVCPFGSTYTYVKASPYRITKHSH